MCAEHDLGTIARACAAAFVREHFTTAAQRKALRAIAACRTSALGGQRQQCDHCGYEHMLWHSCRSRCCPRCQGAARVQWVQARSSELLPVPYFHVVFTVPEQLNRLARRAPRLFYDLLFRAAGAALSEIALSRLHVRIGALAVLHTWSQTLVLHPHIHCVVPGGGFSLDGRRWRGVRKPTFFLPVRVLSRRFRTLLCQMLGAATFPSSIDPGWLRVLLARLQAREWVVYAKPPFGGPSQVLAYLANYTHRIAISNSRITGFDGQNVNFRYRHSSAGSITQRVMVLSAAEFLRRFLLHVLPARLVRIRYYGFMSNRTRTASLVRARALIGSCSVPSVQLAQPVEPSPCPRCQVGTLRMVGVVPPDSSAPSYEDTS